MAQRSSISFPETVGTRETTRDASALGALPLVGTTMPESPAVAALAGVAASATAASMAHEVRSRGDGVTRRAHAAGARTHDAEASERASERDATAIQVR